MVRKISNKKELKQKKEDKKKAKEVLRKNPVMTSEQIDKEIKENLDLIEKYLTEEEMKKIKLLTTDSSDPTTMARIFAVIKNIRDKNKNNELSDDFMVKSKEEIILSINQYEKEYIPTMTTMLYLSLLGINKSIGRYFSINYYKRNFSKDNKDYKYSNESYRLCNNMLKCYPIKLDKERVFVGAWEEKIKSLSKSLNKLLCRLDKFRDLYIIREVIEREFKELKDSIETVEFSEQVLSKKDCAYIKVVFGKDKAEEMIKHYSKSPKERYPYEYNLIKNILFYNSTLLNEKNLSILRKELINATYLNTRNTFLADDIIQNVRNVFKEINTFVLNFNSLVSEGNELFDENIPLPVVRLNHNKVSVNFK